MEAKSAAADPQPAGQCASGTTRSQVSGGGVYECTTPSSSASCMAAVAWLQSAIFNPLELILELQIRVCLYSGPVS
jgi:hypothetical protein